MQWCLTMYKTRKSRRYFYYFTSREWWQEIRIGNQGAYTGYSSKCKRTKCYKNKSNHKVRTHPFAQSGGWYKKVFDYKWTIS